MCRNGDNISTFFPKAAGPQLGLPGTAGGNLPHDGVVGRARVDGFRVDAISYLDKPEDFPDSPAAPEPDGYSFCMALLAVPAPTPISGR